ncbi:histidine phosphatase family protein [Paenibacillus oceani]|uniref:Histidine phosphatase family protein n=1 Tax=Paenibacillus oceani TaxID=2772510 RepID=A0A927H2G1_9BACL|nr:histidine phosphatase family protein [Paenibacillus oceani]MBD2865217.1 histidine phosphatase family protein [Paenibacillus oceani]
MKTTLYLTRHGETEWNVEGRLQGHRDSALTQLGKQQAEWLGAKLEKVPIDAIYCSSSKRASDTADRIRGTRDIPIIPMDSLKEIHFGDWEGQNRVDLERTDSAKYSAFWNEPHTYVPSSGGESFVQLSERVIPALTELIAAHRGGTLLIVTHAVALKMMMAYFRGDPLKKLWQPPIIHPTALSKVVLDADRGDTAIEMLGDTSHYRVVRKAVGAIVFQGNKVMLVRKVASSYGKMDGVWDFPKGGVEDSDSDPEQAVLRELLEETGSDRYRIVRQLPEPFTFTFGEEIRAKIGYERQETTMFIVEYLGNGDDWELTGGEIDNIAMVDLADVESRLSHEETRDYFLKYVKAATSNPGQPDQEEMKPEC